MHRVLRLTLLFVLLLTLTAATTVEAAETCGTHYVQRGENLFRIALHYGVNMYALAAANNIADVTRIYAGQTLVIPCGGTGYNPNQPTHPPTYNPPTYPSQPAYTPPSYSYYHSPYAYSYYVDCSGFRATSPGAFPNGAITFYWDSPRDYQRIARYQVRIYNALGREVGRYETLGLYTNLTGDVGLGAIGPGVNFSFVVVGITGDNRICQTSPRSVRREWNGTADPIF